MKKIKPYFSGSSNIYETVVPFYYVLKFFGLAPIHLDSKKEKCGMRLQDYFVFFVFFVIYCTIFITALIDTITDSEITNSVLENGWVYQYISMIFQTILMVCYGFWKRKNIGKFLDLIYYFDESIDILNWRFKVSHSKDRMMLIVWIAIICLSSGIIFIMILLSNDNFRASIYRNIIYSCYIGFTHILVLAKFTFSSCAVKIRYEILNKNMRQTKVLSEIQVSNTFFTV